MPLAPANGVGLYYERRGSGQDRLSLPLRRGMLSSARTWLDVETGSGRFDAYLPRR